MTDEREQWDHKYREGSHASLTPDPFLLDAYEHFVTPLSGQPGNALDLAGGVGRHALWLAERSWHVDLLDVSPVGIELANKNALQRGLTQSIDARVCDLSETAWQTQLKAKYDLAVVFFFLDRALFPAIQAALRPGGLLVYKTYTREHPRLRGGKGPSHPMYLLESNELLRAFSGMQVLHYRESVKDRGVAELVARKT